jgi:hypothetical protein
MGFDHIFAETILEVVQFGRLTGVFPLQPAKFVHVNMYTKVCLDRVKKFREKLIFKNPEVKLKKRNG